jgi:hypothetical protein
MFTPSPSEAEARAKLAALAGIGGSLLSVRLSGAAAHDGEPALRWADGLSLTIAEEAYATSRHEAGDGHVRHGHSVTAGTGEVTARLFALAEVPRRGVASIEARLGLTLAVTNHGPAPLSPCLSIGWSGMMPGHALLPPDLAGDIAVAAMVRDRRDGAARFLSTISGPVAGDRKVGGTEEGGAAEPGILAALLPPHGLACGGCSPDISEEPLALAPLAPGQGMTLTWDLVITAEARAGSDAAPSRPGTLLSRRVLALTGKPLAS